MADEQPSKKKRTSSDDVIGGVLDVFGLRIDLGQLLGSSEELKDRLEQLRQGLQAAGGKASVSDEEWRSGGATVTGHIRVRDLSGEKEYYVGTLGKDNRKVRREDPKPPESAEPPVDVFDEAKQVTVVADVPGVSLQDLDLKLEGDTLTIATKGRARRRYEKSVQLGADVDPDSMVATCRNGVLEVRFGKQGAEQS